MNGWIRSSTTNIAARTMIRGARGSWAPAGGEKLVFSGRNGHLYPKPAGFKSYRQIHSNNYNYNYQYGGGTSRTKKVLGGMAVVAGVFGAAYYFWWPKHTFPSPVAAKLRRGLWAESDKGENDYQLALKYYLEALEQAQAVPLDPLSDEYTGIQLKIAEMYERLMMLPEANLVYNEIATLYLKVLSMDDKHQKMLEDLKNHLIQKDLRVVVKLVELNKTDLNLCKAILFTHSIIPNIAITKTLENSVASIDLSTISAQNNPYLEKLGRLKFVEEFLNMTNLLIAINISLGDYSLASTLNVNLTKLMLLSNASPDKVLISQCNLGSLLYLQNEQFELNLINLFKSKGLEFASVNFSLLAPIGTEEATGTVDETTGQTGEAGEADGASPSYANFSPQEIETFNINLANCKQTLALSIEAYENVLKMANNLVVRGSSGSNQTPDLSPEDVTKITEIISLSTYSLGVTNLHVQNYDKAERYLREARVKSKSCNYTELITEIERELQKVFTERVKSLKDT